MIRYKRPILCKDSTLLDKCKRREKFTPGQLCGHWCTLWPMTLITQHDGYLAQVASNTALEQYNGDICKRCCRTGADEGASQDPTNSIMIQGKDLSPCWLPGGMAEILTGLVPRKRPSFDKKVTGYKDLTSRHNGKVQEVQISCQDDIQRPNGNSLISVGTRAQRPVTKHAKSRVVDAVRVRQ